jgi:nicotinamidase-related amidase
MGEYRRKRKPTRLLLDICTQRDFLIQGAILQVANLKTLVPNIKQLFAWIRDGRHPVFSSVESHRLSEPSNGFPLHCIDDTPGQKKMSFTLLSGYTFVETDNYLSLPATVHTMHGKYQQLIFRKRSRDVLGNPKADRFLTQYEADEFIIFGVGLERAIKALALGLQSRHKNVTVVSDGCGYWSSADADLALRQLEAKGIRLATTEELTAQATEPARQVETRPGSKTSTDNKQKHSNAPSQ